MLTNDQSQLSLMRSQVNRYINQTFSKKKNRDSTLNQATLEVKRQQIKFARLNREMEIISDYRFKLETKQKAIQDVLDSFKDINSKSLVKRVDVHTMSEEQL